MKKLLLYILFLSVPFCGFAQLDIEEFTPFPKNIEKINALQYSIYEGDTISENYFEYNFDEKGNIIHWHYFTYHMMEAIKYDSLNRITEIDGLYGESNSNGLIHYLYPSKNQKIEIHDKMGFYQYIRSDYSFDENNRISKEIKYDSTFNLMDSSSLVSKIKIDYLYDKMGNKIQEIQLLDSIKEPIYQMYASYDKDKFITKKENFSANSLNSTYLKEQIQKDSYIKEGKFKNKIDKKTTIAISEKDTTNYEVSYLYTALDSFTIIVERKYFFANQLNQIDKAFYYKDKLVRLEEYYISKEDQNATPELEMWTEYTYFFYPKNKE